MRIDGGVGRGHHHHVRTGGEHSKFGVPVAELERCAARAAPARASSACTRTAAAAFSMSATGSRPRDLLARARAPLPGCAVGGRGRRPGCARSARTRPSVDLAGLDTRSAAVQAAHPQLSFWMEPGRYLVAQAGVLLARVTQLKSKGESATSGVATGMNSLIRPALYGAYHEIVNLTRVDEPATELANIVGPICESGDILGHDRLLPPTLSGDVLLVANVGAYGHAMSSHYTLREPAEELCI